MTSSLNGGEENSNFLISFV